MTREEAIAELKRDIELDNDFTEEYINAVNMAIKVLEQEPFINKNCISKGVCHEDKNKILDKISAEIENQDKWLECGTPKDNKYNFCPKCGERLIEPQENYKDDIDEIVERLEAAKSEIASVTYCKAVSNKGLCENRNCFECCAEYLIEIVKAGGKGE